MGFLWAAVCLYGTYYWGHKAMLQRAVYEAKDVEVRAELVEVEGRLRALGEEVS